MAEYRIVRDRFSEYEVQIRRWWWPFWVQAGIRNSHSSVERAEDFALRHAAGCVGEVKRIGHLSKDAARAALAKVRGEDSNG